MPVSAFYSKKVNQKIVRVCFAKTEELLAEAGEMFNKIT
ncbi:MAG: aspartate/methionine/tyrosine aminotransferase [Granulosicoccus sp.]